MKKFLYLLLLFTVCGCATRRVYLPLENVSVRTDTVHELLTRRDTIIERDSVALVQRGDTVYLTKCLLRERIRERRDTLYRTIVDTVRLRQTLPPPTAPGSSLPGRLKRAVPTLILLLLLAALLLRRRSRS